MTQVKGKSKNLEYIEFIKELDESITECEIGSNDFKDTEAIS